VAEMTADQQALAEAHRGIAGMVAGRYARHLHCSDAQPELFGVACLALCLAAQRFDPRRGFAFSTYASQCCTHAVVDALRVSSLVTVSKWMGRLAQADHRYQPMRTMARRPVLGGGTLLGRIDPDANPVHQAELREMRDRIRGLPARERYAIERVLDGWTQREIGAAMGLGRGGVWRLLASGKDHLGCTG